MSSRYIGGIVTKNPTALNPALGNSANGIFTLDQYVQQKSAGTWPAFDPYYDFVTLNLHGNGTNGAQNNTFLDSSTNNFTITRNGNTTQGTFSPYGSNWSTYLGSGNGFSFGGQSAFALGTGDYTIECWFYKLGSGGSIILDFRPSSTNGRYPIIYHASGVCGLDINGTILSSGAVALNTWNHMALVRASGVTRFYINGTQSGSTLADTRDYLVGASRPNIGINGFTPQDYFDGYISNLRIVKGTAVYTSNFTPSTTPLTAITNTSLLTCADNRFIDDSTNNFALTVTGSPSVQRFSPFAPTSAYSTSVIGGSGYFDGSGDYLSLANPNTNIGSISGDFTFECWINWVTAPSGNSSGNERQIIGQHSWPESSSGNWWAILGVNVGLYAYFAGGGSYDLISSSSFTWNVGAWYHVAVVRSGSTVTIYINGISVGSGTSTKTLCADNVRPLTIGADNDGSHNASNAYISNMRLVKGTAVYTSAFTPPTAPLTAITNTSLLLNYTNAGILDNAMMSDLETVGNAQISTSVKKYGTGSIAFDGSGDWLNAISSPNYGYGSGDFTIEFWAYPTSSSGVQVFLDQRTGSSTSAVPTIYTSSGTIYYYVSGSNRITGSSLSLNQWSHIAICRSGTLTKLFINGTQSGSTYTDTTTYLNAPVRIGDGNDGAGPYPYSGYIDDLRITKGYARYTANFTAPTSQLQDQ
jgi:hypothetical protein